MQDSGIMLPADSVSTANEINKALRYLMQMPEPPTALICSYDLLASYVEKQCSLLDIHIPHDLSLVGFDNINIAEHLEIPLTTAAQDYDRIGKTAVDVLRAIKNGEPVKPAYLFDIKIIERDSVRALTD